METFERKANDPLNIDLRPHVTFVHSSNSLGGELRIDMSNRIGMLNRRAWGFVVDIAPSASGNTRAPFEVQILTRIVYIRPNEGKWRCVCVRIAARTSNMTVADFDTLIAERAPTNNINIRPK